MVSTPLGYLQLYDRGNCHPYLSTLRMRSSSWANQYLTIFKTQLFQWEIVNCEIASMTKNLCISICQYRQIGIRLYPQLGLILEQIVCQENNRKSKHGKVQTYIRVIHRLGYIDKVTYSLAHQRRSHPSYPLKSARPTALLSVMYFCALFVLRLLSNQVVQPFPSPAPMGSQTEVTMSMGGGGCVTRRHPLLL